VETDVLVIGGGAAGAVIAGRLATMSSRRVLLAEAGGTDRHPFYRVPLLTGYLAQRPRGTWRHPVEPEDATGDRDMVWPQGKVLGGSSAINGMVWMRGRPSDYDGWAALMGSPDWAWDAVKPSFDALEGPGGIPVWPNNGANPLFPAFVEAGAQAGFQVSNDFNQAPYEGIGRFSSNVANGRRWSSAQAFLAPARHRPSLTVMTAARALRLIVDGGAVVGAIFQKGGREIVVRARETVVCAGAVNSPTLLLHSGIGDAAELRELGIAPVLDLPAVGRNLQDHFGGRVSGVCRLPVSLHAVTHVDRAAWVFARSWLTGTGIAASSPFGAGFLLRSTPSEPEPDLEGVLIPALSTARLRRPSFLGGDDSHAYTCAVYPLRPGSRGAITLRSADPFADPVIHPNYLSDPHDLALIRAGIRIVRRILDQPAFAPYRGAEILPGAEVQDDSQLDRAIAAMGATAFHPVGTCRMGRADDGAVVGADLRVHGLTGLRVADASIMPRITSGNTNAPTMMIGYRCAEMLARD
jgi:choline dehydrogenase